MYLVKMLLEGYLTTVSVEVPILLVLLSARHGVKRTIVAALWITLCSYPLVVLTLPSFFPPTRSRLLYYAAAESTAITIEVVLFLCVFGQPGGSRNLTPQRGRDCFAIILANASSFLVGEALSFRGLW